MASRNGGGGGDDDTVIAGDELVIHQKHVYVQVHNLQNTFIG
jgi:hypothetical protein